MFEVELRQLQCKLDRIAAEPPHWTETKIGNYEGGILRDAERISGSDWWKRSEPRDASNREVIRLVERAGLGTLRIIRDGKEEENVWGGERRSGTTASAVAEHQRDREKVGVHDAEEYETYLPEPEDNAWAWANALAMKVDTNTAESRPWYSALLSYIHKFPQTSQARDLDQETVGKLVKEICDGGHQ
jgi:hypothetical protein